MAPLVFITGASSGIGQALAARYLQAGWRLALVARRGDSLRDWAAQRGLDASRCAASTRPTCSRSTASSAAGRACIEAQGLPDVVIANAGISVGVDTGDRGDLDALRDTFATNRGRLAATFHPFVNPMRKRRQRVPWWALPAWRPSAACPATAPTAAARPAVVAYCESLRGECRAVRRAGGDPAAGLYRHAADGAQPLSDAVPDDGRGLCRPGLSRHRGRHQLPRDSLADGVVAKLLRLLPNAWFDRLFAGRGRKPRRTPT
jgi:NADP-dependent 3-hydroxy acid dehydrogenase YdfG